MLIIDEELPYPLTSGKRIRTFNLVSRLTKYVDITFLAYGEPGSPAAVALRNAGIEVHAVPGGARSKRGIRFYLALLANLLERLPYIVTSHVSRTMRRAVRRELASSRHNIVLCEWTPYVEVCKGVDDVPIIVAAHNVEAAIWARYAVNEENWLRRWYINVQHAKVRRFESGVLARVRGVMAVSQDDARAFQALNAAAHVDVVENGVDLQYFHCDHELGAPDEVVFCGSMDWRPNQDGVAYFCAEIWAKIRDRAPNARFTIVGRDPPQAVRELVGEDITVTGTVDDVRPYVRRARVMVVPLRIGGGSRLKILEALALGRVVVSTTIGAEGLEVTHGLHLLLADGPREFAGAVLRVMQDRDLAQALAAAGRALVEERYGWDPIAEKMAQKVLAFAAAERR
jgi:polysaccharide biosynthesis protein PslH